MKSNPTRPILLVEDDPMDADLTRRAFEANHLANPIELLRDGQEALDYLAAFQPGSPCPLVILLDLKLPKVHGLEVLKAVRQHAHLAATPVVVLTSSSMDSDVQAAYTLGANSYILKLVNFDKFIEVAKTIELYWVLLNHPV